MLTSVSKRLYIPMKCWRWATSWSPRIYMKLDLNSSHVRLRTFLSHIYGSHGDLGSCTAWSWPRTLGLQGPVPPSSMFEAALTSLFTKMSLPVLYLRNMWDWSVAEIWKASPRSRVYILTQMFFPVCQAACLCCFYACNTSLISSFSISPTLCCSIIYSETEPSEI